MLDPLYVPLGGARRAARGRDRRPSAGRATAAAVRRSFRRPGARLERRHVERPGRSDAAEVLVALLALAWLARGVRRQRTTRPRRRDRGGDPGHGRRWRCFRSATPIEPVGGQRVAEVARAAARGGHRGRPGARRSVACRGCIGAHASWRAPAKRRTARIQFATGSGPATFQVDGALRAFGHFDQPNPFAGYLSTILPLAVLIVLCGQAARPLRVCAAVSALAIVGGVALSQSRGAWLGVATAGLVLLLLWSPRTRLLLLPIAAVTTVFGAAALGNLLPASVARPACVRRSNISECSTCAP